MKGKEAERFVKEAENALLNKGKVNFSKQVREARAVLRKAKML